MTGCVNRRSTRTTTVLSCLSLTTTPCSVRLGIFIPYYLRLGLGARGALRLGCGFGLGFGSGLGFGLGFGLGLRRLRVAGALQRRDRLDARDVTPHLAHASCVLELARRPLK